MTYVEPLRLAIVGAPMFSAPTSWGLIKGVCAKVQFRPSGDQPQPIERRFAVVLIMKTITYRAPRDGRSCRNTRAYDASVVPAGSIDVDSTTLS